MFKKTILAVSLIVGVGCLGQRYVGIVNETLPKTVTIYVTEDVPDYLTGSTQTINIMGAGVFVNPSGYVLTVNHLFEGSTRSVTVELYDGRIYHGDVLFKSKKRDLALVKINEKNLPWVFIKSPTLLRVGEEILAIGAPLAQTFSASNGIIAALHDDKVLYNAVQVTTSCNPGNSGGPVIDLYGDLVGVSSFYIAANSFFPTYSGVGFAVESGEIIKFLTDYKHTKRDKDFFYHISMGYWF